MTSNQSLVRTDGPTQDLSLGLPLTEPSQFMPMMSVELAVERYNVIQDFVKRILKRDVDYGVIPGTDKFTLLKAGAEKLTTFFGLSTRFSLIDRVEDWSGIEHEGEPFFYYLYRCQLFRGDLLIAEADGSCNSRETKYRYREAQRVCPDCRQAAIIRGKEEYGGGYICFRKKGGCGAKFSTGDPAIESQTVGRIPNPDIADQVNTMQKMGQKRAMVASVLQAVNASDFFIDLEDGVIETHAVAVSSEPLPRSAHEPSPSFSEAKGTAPPATPANSARQTLLGKIDVLREKLKKEQGVTAAELNEALGQYGCIETSELDEAQARKYLADLSQMLNDRLREARR